MNLGQTNHKQEFLQRLTAQIYATLDSEEAGLVASFAERFFQTFPLKNLQGQSLSDIFDLTYNSWLSLESFRADDLRYGGNISEQLQTALRTEFGEEHGKLLHKQYAHAFSAAYRSHFDFATMVADIRSIGELDTADVAIRLYRAVDDKENVLRFRLFHKDQELALSDMLPVLENLGMRVVGEHPYCIKRGDGSCIWLHDFQLIYGLADSIRHEIANQNFVEAFKRIWAGDAECDPFNKLILGTTLVWREIALLRTYAHYMKQIALNYSENYVAETLSRHLDITNDLVSLFKTRFDPKFTTNAAQREASEKKIEAHLAACLESVENLTEDHIIHEYVCLIKATVRTNYFQTGKDGQHKNYFSLKFCPRSIPQIPKPCPMFEVFVYSPRIEGVHLRSGKVARGGLRWSNRHEDYRTEVLGLVKAQQVKNSVIVPVGAKGGFFAKKLPSDQDREGVLKEGVACYKTFINGLLDITDNLVDGKIVAPTNVLRKDDDDPYLVVAADKGTATFSDIANKISQEHGFWLGDAFASGGSVGYDHKKMGITASGAWVSVQRHFREMGINIQDEDFTVVGIGDMSGDVFGNGMLLSKHVRLVAAFNHQHIFVDPDPDAAKTFPERKRLFDLPRSSWEDFDQTLISSGGGIFSRAAKSITMTPEIKARFGIEENRLPPNDFIKAILKSEVDLLWNGGIGTYIKAAAETHLEVGDKGTDNVRVDANTLRCRVIGEGGNLGVTQLGRVEFALNGGASNTDFIDNAGGVDCSDNEVNIKILLNDLVDNGIMSLEERNVLLRKMTGSVSQLVLKNIYRQTQAISIAEREAFIRVGEYRRLISQLESDDKLDRTLEFIPDDEAIVARKAANKALTRPELSVLISYGKLLLKEGLLDSSVPDDPYIARSLSTAFPQLLREKYSDHIDKHILRREIIATQIAGDLVNRMGITFIYRMEQATGELPANVVKAYVAARDVFDMDIHWQAIEELDYQVSSELQMEMMSQLIRLVRRASRWFLRNRRADLDPGNEIKHFRPAMCVINDSLGSLLDGVVLQTWQNQKEHYINEGVPEQLAHFVASAPHLYTCLGIAEAADLTNSSVQRVAEIYFAMSEQLELHWFGTKVANIKVDNYWQALARESLRDDLELQQRTLAICALKFSNKASSAQECTAKWLEEQAPYIARWHAMVKELRGSDTMVFEMYPVAIRELLDLAQASEHACESTDYQTGQTNGTVIQARMIGDNVGYYRS